MMPQVPLLPQEVALAIGALVLLYIGLMIWNNRPYRKGYLPALDETDPCNYFQGTEEDVVRWCEDPMEMYRERIVATALRHPSGIIYWAQAPLRHHNVINNHMGPLGVAGSVNTHDQGFITSHGRYVHRREAMAIARHSRQLVRQTGNDASKLYSEDLWY